MKYYWVCEHYDSGVGLFKCHACYKSPVKAYKHAAKLNAKELSLKFYVEERTRPLSDMEKR